MPNYVASYELNNFDVQTYETFRESATSNGWTVWIMHPEQVWYQLPAATLTGAFDSHHVAVSALQRACSLTASRLGREILMNKWLVAEWRTCNFDSDRREAAGN